MLLKEINHLTSENGEFNSTMDTVILKHVIFKLNIIFVLLFQVNEQFQILMSMFPKPDDNQTPEDEVVNDDTSVIIEEVQEVNSDTSA